MTETVVQNEQLRRYVETHHIDMIPAGARHGKPWHQAAFWAGANVNVFNVFLGGVVVSFGLTFWWAVIAIIAGTLAGALFIALHATQGPRLGVPQTIQSRGQFGFYGSAFLFPCVLLLNVGFIAAQLVIQAQSAQGVISSLTIPEWILILAVPAVPRRPAALGGRGRAGAGHRPDLRQVGAHRDGAEPDQLGHAQRVHRGIPGPGARQYVAPLQVGIGHAPRRAIRLRDGRRRGNRLYRLPAFRQQPVQLPPGTAGRLHSVVRGQPHRLLPRPARQL